MSSMQPGHIARQMKCAAWMLCLCSLNVWAGDGLQVYFNKALTNDPEFAAARATYASEAEYRTIGRSNLLPSLTLTADTNKNQYQRKDIGVLPPRDYRFTTDSTSLRFLQPLFDLERWANYREADARAERAKIVLADARQDLAVRLAKSYFNYLMAVDTQELSVAQSQAVTAQRIKAENLYRGGVATITDVEESKAREQLALAQEFVTRNAIEQRRKELSKLIGELPAIPVNPASMPSSPLSVETQRDDFIEHQGVLRTDTQGSTMPLRLARELRHTVLLRDSDHTALKPSLTVASVRLRAPKLELPNPNDISVWVTAARTQNLKVQSLQAMVAITGFQRDRNRAGYFPKLSLIATHQSAQNPNYFTGQDYSNQVGMQLSMNLFNGGSTLGATRQSAAQIEKTQQDAEAAMRDAEILASESFLGVVNGVEQVRALRQALISAEVTLRGMEAGQKAGLRTNSEVLNAQQQFFSTKRDLQKAGYDYLLSRLTLQGATGTLNESDMALVDQLFAATEVSR